MGFSVGRQRFRPALLLIGFFATAALQGCGNSPSFSCLMRPGIVQLMHPCGPSFGEVQPTLQPVAKDKARIILFRDSHFMGWGASNDVKIDDKPVGNLANGTFLVADHDPGDIRIALIGDFFSGDFAFSFEAKAGETYYVEYQMDGSTDAPIQGGGFVTISAHAEKRDFCGPGWCAGRESAAEALPKLANLRRGDQAAN